MADRLTLYLAKSIAKHLADNVAGLDAAYVTSVDFDYDQKPDPSDPRSRITRDLPFVGVEILTTQRQPFTITSNILIEAVDEYVIGVFAAGYSQLLNITGDMRQVLSAATLPQTGKVGVPLYDFGTPMSGYFDLHSAVDIDDFGLTNYLGPTGVEEFENRKHRSFTPIVFSAFKDKNANLLENLGNINLNE